MTIGIIGVYKGAGTTHLSIMLATYLAMVMGERTALVEFNSSGCLRQAEIIRSNIDRSRYSVFNKKVSIFKESGMEEISEIVSRNYSYVIIDYGCDYNKKQLFLLNNIKLVVGNLSWWMIQHYVSFAAVTSNDKSRRTWQYLGNNVSERTWKYMKKHMGITIKGIPYEPDPFFLSRRTIGFMTELTAGW